MYIQPHPPTHPQPPARTPNASRVTRPRHVLSQRSERIGTCWFFFSPHLSFQVPQNKAVPRSDRTPRTGAPQGKQAQVGAGANGAPPGEHHADMVGWSAGDSSGLCEAARFAPLHLSGSEGRAILPPAAAAPTIPLPPYKICPPLLATFPMLRFSSHSPWVPRAHIV